MKKIYLQPDTNLVKVATASMIAVSGKLGGDLDMSIKNTEAEGEAEGRRSSFWDEE